ncbi:MAG: hypothetical protein R2911_35710 [Caldilineaceae bacterium]
MLVENTLLPLVRRSLTVGISFAASCNVPNNMASKLYSLFGERVTFKQSNSDRYMDIVAAAAVEIDDIPGNGYRRMSEAHSSTTLPSRSAFLTRRAATPAKKATNCGCWPSRCRVILTAAKSRCAPRPDPIPILEEIVPLHKCWMRPEQGRMRLQAVAGGAAISNRRSSI